MTFSLHIHGSSLVPPGVSDDDPTTGCCIGEAVYGPTRCTCWTPVFDQEQQPLQNGGRAPDIIFTRQKCCSDCAYRKGSKEREDEWEEEEIMDHALTPGCEFWCHAGVRRVVAYRHPDGRKMPAGDGDYQPPIGPRERPLVWRADGTPGSRCAGWAAYRRGLEE
jgi:hypothetical protein